MGDSTHSHLPAMNDDLWVMQAPVLSTGHLTQATMERLSQDNNAFGLYTITYDKGVFVFCSDASCLQGAADDDKAPDDLAACFRWAMGRGYEWSRFDADGSTVEALPTYRWGMPPTLAEY